jgi:hypothetical protein
MHAVAPCRQREVGTIVHEEGDAALLRHGPERVGSAADRVVVGVLEAKLDRGDVARIECARELSCEVCRREARRRDEIEAGRQLSPL